MYILGINAYHGDAAAALVKDGEIVAAAEEERFNRIKHCAGFPKAAIKYCLSAAGVGIDAVDHIGISRDPSAHLHKKILFAAGRAARRAALRQKRSSKITQPASGDNVAIADFRLTEAPFADSHGNGHNGRGLIGQIRDRLGNAAKIRNLRDDLAESLGVRPETLRAQFHNVEHHRAHLASCFYVSPFEHAALLSIDGFGDFISTMWGRGDGNRIQVLGQVEYPHSMGILYSATTQFLGFPYYGDEGKVMGLAPYGRPRFINEFRQIIQTTERGGFTLDPEFFRHHAEGVEMSWDGGSPVIGRLFSNEFTRMFGRPRAPGADLTDRDRDLAASLQQRLEEVAFHLLRHLYQQTSLNDLGLSGGVAYNSVMNGKILLQTPFERIFVQPAAGDSGTALGVCFEVYNGVLDQARGTVMHGAYTGPGFDNEQIRTELEGLGLDHKSFGDDSLTQSAAQDIANGMVLGWFQGRMEFGPRALGNRSILVDPRRAEIKTILNERVKKREPFRPFAPSILEEYTAEYFEQSHPAPTMLMVYKVRPERRPEIPAVTHVDGSGRLQTVSREVNARYYDLIVAFHKLTGVPILLNTSFNENEPIVCTPREAIECFLKTRMDVLYIGNWVVRKGVPSAVS